MSMSDISFHSSTPRTWIVGLGTQYPPFLIGVDKIEAFVERFYDTEQPRRALSHHETMCIETFWTNLAMSISLRKLLQITGATGIDTRASINDFETDFCCQQDPPSITDLDDFFRSEGVNLAVQACEKAVEEWGGALDDITHTVGVTCTANGLPGYDLLVAEELGLPRTVERVLLQGVGCAGGLAIMRVAAQLACGATARGRPARILAYACELCTPNGRHDLAEAEACADPGKVGISAALFSDGAAAFMLCNDLGLEGSNCLARPIFQLHEWENTTIPCTGHHMGFYPEPMGYRSVLSKAIPDLLKGEVGPLLERLLPSFRKSLGLPELGVTGFDWALHPGGRSIITKLQDELSLTNEQLRATFKIYTTRGNSSSPTVLAVLDSLRQMGPGKDNVAAVSFGPGLTIEMALLTRVRHHSMS